MILHCFQFASNFMLESGVVDDKLTRKSESSLFKQDSSPNPYAYTHFECL